MAARKLAYPTFKQPPYVTFGTGSVRVLAQLGVLERAVVLMSGDADVRQTMSLALGNRGVAIDSLRMLHKPAGEPTADSVETAAAWLAQHPFDALIAVGGGSVLDWARLALAASRGWLDVRNGRMRSELAASDRPLLVLVPTTCGSGAEASAVAVYALNGQKMAVVSDAFLADRVVLDAQFLAAASPGAVASWVSDALSHAIEGFVSIVPNALAKQAAVGALSLILQYYESADPHCRRERLMDAGYLGGIAASNCSVGVVHAFAHTIAAYGVSHGLANALGLPAGIAANADSSELRVLLDRLDLTSVESLIQAIAPVTSEAVSAGVPERLRTALSDPCERDLIAERMANDVCLRSNPTRLDRDALQTFIDRVDTDLSRV